VDLIKFHSFNLKNLSRWWCTFNKTQG